MHMWWPIYPKIDGNTPRVWKPWNVSTAFGWGVIFGMINGLFNPVHGISSAAAIMVSGFVTAAVFVVVASGRNNLTKPPAYVPQQHRVGTLRRVWTWATDKPGNAMLSGCILLSTAVLEGGRPRRLRNIYDGARLHRRDGICGQSFHRIGARLQRHELQPPQGAFPCGFSGSDSAEQLRLRANSSPIVTQLNHAGMR